MKILRPYYLDLLLSAMGNGCAKIVTGLRRCGKSYLLSTLFKEYLLNSGVKEDHIIEVSLDRDDFEELQNPRNLSAYVKSRLIGDGAMNYVFIDEIQLSYKVRKRGFEEGEVAPEDAETTWLTFYDVLNSLNARKDVDIYVTGSNSKMLSSDIVGNFRGRKTEIALSPLSFSEFHGFKKRDLLDDWQEFMTFGGLPQVVLANSDKEKIAILKELYLNVYVKDIVERQKISSPELFENITSFLESSIGSLSNPSRIEKGLKHLGKEAPSAPTIRKYLTYLTDAYLFCRANRYDIQGRKHLDYPVKYYAEDTGLRNWHLGFREIEETHLMENIIFSELKRRGYEVDAGVIETCETVNGRREVRQHEIDFVVNTGAETIYIQTTYLMRSKEQLERESLPLKRVRGSFRRLIITFGNGRLYQDDSGIFCVGLFPFLLKPEILEGFWKA